MTKDRTVLSWIKGYRIEFSRPVIQYCQPRQPVPTTSEIPLFEEAIQDLLLNGAISKCEACEHQFLSNIFLRPKPNGKTRLILNLKNLNKYIETQHFKLEDLRTAVKLVNKDCLMATLDLKDAYFLVKIHPESRKYLRFSWNGQLYEFNVLPFGLNTAPFIFTKILKPVVKMLRSCGHLSTIYLDDLLLLGNSYSNCINNIEVTISLLTALGFKINQEKSKLSPSTSVKFLGYIIDSHSMKITLPKEKRMLIKAELQKFTKLKSCKIRKFARLVGLLISACPAVEYGILYTKNFERCKYLNLQGHDDYERIMQIPSSLLPDIRWWLNVIDHPYHRIKDDQYTREIYSDASTTGWGAVCGTESAAGQWSQHEAQQHINYLELIAAFIALKIFAKDLSSCQVLLRIDSSTAISYINRMGGVQFPHLTQVAKDIWQWCESRKIFVFAAYVESSKNIADEDSRRVHPDIEWELADSAFQALTDKFGMPTIDLFASRINRKCEKYISWRRDPDAYSINAFTINWHHHFFYAFPPFSIILKVLRKIQTDGARGILVVPHWPTQPWYPMFMGLLVSDVITFEPGENLIISHSSRRNVHSSITLVAGILSGRQ